MKTGDRENGTAATRLGDGLTRRGVIVGLTSLLAAPKQSSAQQSPAKVPRVGWLWAGDRQETRSRRLDFARV